MPIKRILASVFDPPLPAPTPDKPFRPFPEAYVTGPVPGHLKEENAARLLALVAGLTLKEAERLVEFGSFWLDDRPCLNPREKLGGHREFRFNPPVYGPVRFYEADPARIVYQDSDILVYNKESGRPSQGVPHDAYNNALSALGRLLAARGEKSALWLPHRLDADTSGLLLLARNRESAGLVGKAFQEGRVKKEYLCLGLGPAPKKASFAVDAPIAKEGRRYLVKPGGPGLESRTGFEALGYEDHTGPGNFKRVLFRAWPRTGRTHQIRLHLAWAGWSIVGDRFYGRPEAEAGEPGARLMLASAALIFPHPRSGELIEARLPGQDG